jgi:hypothetical protein
MSQTKANVAASISSRTRSRRLQREPQFAQDPESRVDTDIEKVVVSGPSPKSSEASVAPASEQGPEAPIIEGSSATDKNGADFVYDRTHFCKDKAY